MDVVGIELSLWHQQHQASNQQTLLQNSIGTHLEEMVAGANAVEQPQRLAGDHALDLGTVLRRRAGASERGDLLLMAGLDPIFFCPPTTNHHASRCGKLLGVQLQTQRRLCGKQGECACVVACE